MKKLVTLSAIALAGATLGVGSTFGWWADESEDSPKPKIKTLDVVPDLQPQSVEVFLKEELPRKVTEEENPKVVIVQTKSPDGKSEAVSGHIHFVQTGGNSAALEKLADELEQEAKEFEGHGQKEAAEIQRKLAQRLRATIKAGQADLRVRSLPPDAKPRHTKSEGEASAEDVKRKLGVLKLELKGHDAEPKKNPEAYAQELKARIHEIEAKPKAHQDAEAQLDKLRAALEQQARLASQKDSAHQAKARHIDQVVGQLRETAEKLEQAGRKDEAHAIREKAEHILQSLKEEHHPKFEKHDIIVEDGQKIIRLRRQSKDGTGDEELAIIQAEPKGPRKVISKEQAEKGDLPARIKVEGFPHGDGAPLFEVQRMLKELRHEIQELREDVRGLRGLLSADPRSVKTKVRHIEDDDDDEKGDDDKVDKPVAKDRKVIILDRAKGEVEEEQRDKEKKSSDVKRDDDDDDDDKSDKRKVKKDDDRKSEDREEKDDDESAETEGTFKFYTGFFK